MARRPPQTPSPQTAETYAQTLLADLGWQAAAAHLPALLSPAITAHPARAWAATGLADTGLADTGQISPAPLAMAANGAGLALAALSAAAGHAHAAHALPPGAAWLGARRALRADRKDPGRGCRLLPARDGWIALNLARADDDALLPAWLEDDSATQATLAALIATRPRAELLDRAALLGLAAAGCAQHAANPPPWCAPLPAPAPVPPANPNPARKPPPRVLDLAALWAGPLAAQLLRLTGASVTKLESTTRPDGARLGDPAFFALLNHGKSQIALDLTSAAGRAALRAHILHADIVIDSARPRAWRQMGLDPQDLLAARPGLIWCAISGYGRAADQDMRIAYGDDAAIAAGLSRAAHRAGQPRATIIGDAIADPLTGLHAALAALAAYYHAPPAGSLLALSLTGVTARAMAGTLDLPPQALRRRQQRWQRIAQGTAWRYQLPAIPAP